MRKMTYRQMVEAGLCTSCGKESDSALCTNCRERRNEQRRASRQYKKMIGQCVRCSNAAEPGKTLCLECMGSENDKYHDSGKKKDQGAKMRTYYERKESGICTRCGKRDKEKGLLCGRCYGKYRAKKEAKRCDILRSERLSYGLCYVCGKPKMTDRNVCESCYEVRKQTIPAMIAVTNNDYFRQLNGLVFKGAR